MMYESTRRLHEHCKSVQMKKQEALKLAVMKSTLAYRRWNNLDKVKRISLNMAIKGIKVIQLQQVSELKRKVYGKGKILQYRLVRFIVKFWRKKLKYEDRFGTCHIEENDWINLLELSYLLKKYGYKQGEYIVISTICKNWIAFMHEHQLQKYIPIFYELKEDKRYIIENNTDIAWMDQNGVIDIKKFHDYYGKK